MAAEFILLTAALDQIKQNFGGLKHLPWHFDVSYALAHSSASDTDVSVKHYSVPVLTLFRIMWIMGVHPTETYFDFVH